jgi:nucleoside-diphosphate-sugar epimerase
MKVIVTGSSGLIGRWVGERLDRESIPWAGLDRLAKIDGQGCVVHYQGDVNDTVFLTKAFDEFQPTHVIHLAARCDLEGQTLEDYETNRGGVEGLCQVVSETESVQRVIYTSSQLVCEVGYVPKSDEDYCPHTVYGESKVETEKVVRRLDGGGVEWCLARPTTVWGPHMSEHYQSLLKHIKAGTYFHSGRGKLYKSYSYAENIAHQYWKLLTADREEIHQQTFYMADYEPLSLRDYANALADEMGVKRPWTMPLPLARLLGYGGDLLSQMGIKFPYNSFRLRNIRTEYVFDLSKTEEVCGPLPKQFEEGVRETAEWFVREKNKE